ncbi:hypothetical protein [Streptomyces olivaceus]|uniref:hypothetical protein n=1 Tax=Streptomyces olivaceus TaxID=47716 RepID=UPI004056FA5E
MLLLLAGSSSNGERPAARSEAAAAQFTCTFAWQRCTAGGPAARVLLTLADWGAAVLPQEAVVGGPGSAAQPDHGDEGSSSHPRGTAARCSATPAARLQTDDGSRQHTEAGTDLVVPAHGKGEAVEPARAVRLTAKGRRLLAGRMPRSSPWAMWEPRTSGAGRGWMPSRGRGTHAVEEGISGYA